MEQKPDTQAPAATGGARESVAHSLGRGGILGVKAGMTQIFTEAGESIAVTVIDLQPAIITQVKTKAKNGYNSIQVGFIEKKAKSVNKPEAGHVKPSGATGFYHYQEFRLDDGAKLDAYAVGKVLSPDFVKAGDLVDLTAVSKGKGMQGGMKRFHMSGNYKTHGCSISHRSLGSIGMRADPGRVYKNRKMHGHMGNIRKTIQNVQVVRVDVENQLMLVHGSIPGPKTGIVTVQKTVKNAK